MKLEAKIRQSWFTDGLSDLFKFYWSCPATVTSLFTLDFTSADDLKNYLTQTLRAKTDLEAK